MMNFTSSTGSLDAREKQKRKTALSPMVMGILGAILIAAIIAGLAVGISAALSDDDNNNSAATTVAAAAGSATSVATGTTTVSATTTVGGTTSTPVAGTTTSTPVAGPTATAPAAGATTAPAAGDTTAAATTTAAAARSLPADEKYATVNTQVEIDAKDVAECEKNQAAAAAELASAMGDGVEGQPGGCEAARRKRIPFLLKLLFIIQMEIVSEDLFDTVKSGKGNAFGQLMKTAIQS
ncbi:hypothetical protein SNEBB_004397, partial [Seison nebaliae]